MIDKYLDQVKEFEGFHPTPYWDYKQWTSGYGTKAKNKSELITKATAKWRLNKEMMKAEALVSKFADKHGIDIPRGVHAALSSLTYNAGSTWMKSGLGKKIAKRMYTSGMKNFVQYNRAGGKRLKGLVNRRNAEVLWFKDRKPYESTGEVTVTEKPVTKKPVTKKPASKKVKVDVGGTDIAVGVPSKGYVHWLETAQEFRRTGIKEIKGRVDNPVVVAMWALGRAGNIDEDETPWCAAFASCVLELSGIKSARTGWARSYLQWGKRIEKPREGCIVVFKRGSGGHIGFVVGKTSSGELAVLGGNQSDAVNVRSFDKSRVLGYMWPEGYPVPTESLPIVKVGRSYRES